MSGIVKSRDEVEEFLRQFKPKLDVWGIFFLNRDKNQKALSALGLTGKNREETIKCIEADDYIETIIDALWQGDLWVFGKDFDGTELYIKIAIGKPGTNTICISFHEAEFPLKYAFREKGTTI